jgi:hypothetical protein
MFRATQAYVSGFRSAATFASCIYLIEMPIDNVLRSSLPPGTLKSPSIVGDPCQLAMRANPKRWISPLFAMPDLMTALFSSASASRRRRDPHLLLELPRPLCIRSAGLHVLPSSHIRSAAKHIARRVFLPY